MTHVLSQIAHSSANLLFPPNCKLCYGPIESAVEPLCDPCATLLDIELAVESCPMCGTTVGPYETSDGRCHHCRGRRPPVAATVRLAEYSGGFARLIQSYKYGGRHELGPLLGGWLANAVEDTPWRDRIEAVVSVPTHWRHRLGRPLYAAEALAKVVARCAGLPNVALLRRVRAGPHQIGLSPTARVENVKGAFALARGVQMQDARVLLIDDVRTTGATLNECAKILRQSGAAEVYAAVAVTAAWDAPTGKPTVPTQVPGHP